MKRLFFVLSGVMALVAESALASYDQELWNDPLKANHNWSYYDTDAPSPFDVAMPWSPNGGAGDSGYVRTPLNALDPVSSISTSAYWPAYIYRNVGENQEIDLSIPGATVKVYARDVSMLAPLNLQGGKLHFFIGQWLVGGPGTEDDRWSFFYNLKPVTIASTGWDVESTIQVGNDASWGTIGSNDPTVHPSDLFYHPEQWGFVICPAAAIPSGELALDSFRIVPEPTVLGLLLGLGGLLGSRRRSPGDDGIAM